MRRRLRLVVGVAISLVALYFVVRPILEGNVPLEEVWEVYRKGNYVYVVPGVAVILFTSWARAYRWRLLMYPNQDLPLGRLFSIVNIGYLFNNVLPAKAGEVVRGYLAGRMIPGGMAGALSALLIERLLDVLSVLAILLALTPFVDMPAVLLAGGRVLGLLCAVGVVGLVVLAKFGDRGVDWIWGFLSRLPWIGHPKVETALRNLVAGFRVLTVAKLLPGIVLWSLLIWLGYGLLNYSMMAVLRMTHLPPTVAAFVLCATGLGMAVPSSPGAVGVFEWATVLALGVYGVEDGLALGYAVGLHALTNITLIVLGLLGLRSESLSFADVRGEALEEPTSGACSADP